MSTWLIIVLVVAALLFGPPLLLATLGALARAYQGTYEERVKKMAEDAKDRPDAE